MGNSARSIARSICSMRVVKRNGELKWAARNEQAVIERKLGKPDDAMTLYDEVLQGRREPRGKARSVVRQRRHLYELGAKDRKITGARSSSITSSRATGCVRALAQSGVVQERHVPREIERSRRGARDLLRASSKTTNQARSVVANSFGSTKPVSTPRAYSKSNRNGKPAAAIYEKLAFAGGGRSEEAKSRLDRLRLEHFLWED